MIGVGIIGLGTVGRGTYNILKQYGRLIQHKTGVEVRVVKVAEVDPERSKGLENDSVPVVRDAWELINDPRVAICVELIGGTGVAYDYVGGALKAGKWVDSQQGVIGGKGRRALCHCRASGWRDRF